MLRRGMIVGLCVLATSALSAGAQEREYVYFGWAHVRDSSTTYVTDSVTRSPQFDRSNAQSRFRRALGNQGVQVHQLSAWTVGMPGDMQIEDAREADEARLEFINRERGRGRQVELISW